MKKNRAPQLSAGRRWHFDKSHSAHWSGHPRTVAFLAGLLVLLFAQAGGRANVGTEEPLPFSKGFLVTGNYVVGGVDLTPQANPADMNGYATGTIPISDGALAGGANLDAAYLYFEAVHPSSVTSDATNPIFGIKFRGQAISLGAIRTITKPLSSGGATCWGSAGQGSFAVSMYRANVLSLLPKQFDLQGKWTGKYIVNSAELPVNAQHTVTLREKTGDSAIQSAGATLFLVYRVTTPGEPLRKIVVYDGLYTSYATGVSSSTAEADVMSQHIRGFYKSAGSAARITHIVGTGGNNQTEKITVQATQQTITIGPPPNSNDPFPQTSPSSDRSWGNPTYNLTVPNPFGTPDSTYGATVTTTVSATNTTPAACRVWGAVIYSTEVADVDHDGLPDGLEDAPNPLRDDANEPELPNLHAMGAASTHRDLFVEYNAMWAGDNPFTPADEGLTTTYGSTDAPYPNTTEACYHSATKSCIDTVGHHHFPTPEDWKRIGDRFKAQNPPITLHVDVGNVSAYHGLGVVQHTDWEDDYTSTAADEYLVGNGVGTNVAALARGGEVVKERACSETNPDCIFPDYPGSVGWKDGLLAIRNAPVNDSGGELNSDTSDPTNASFNWLNGSQHRLRFDRERRPYFHYGLGAHTRGTGILPCLTNPGGNPTGYFDFGVCADPSDLTPNQTNPEFSTRQVPSSAGGIGDLPGRNFLATHGLWDELVGRPYARAVTIFHELGHNLYLWHSGVPADFGDADENTVIEANCKPNLITSMNYLYEHQGLFDQFGHIQLDFSHGALPVLHENALSADGINLGDGGDGASLTTQPYRRAWYAPFYLLDGNGNPTTTISPLVASQGAAKAARFCGKKFGAGDPLTEMARVVSPGFAQTGWYIDWNGDQPPLPLGGQPDNPSPVQDVNFDGLGQSLPPSYSDTFTGYNDWANIRLDQISANGLKGGLEDLIFLDDEFISLTGDDEFISLTGDDEYISLTGDDEFISLTGDDEFISLTGDDEYINLTGDDEYINLTGDDEPTYKGTQELGPAAPYELVACIVGEAGCFNQAERNDLPDLSGAQPPNSPYQPFKPLYHRVAVGWRPTTVGHVNHYQVQKKRADAPDSSYVDVGDTGSPTDNFIIDEEVLPKLMFTYRVRAHLDNPAAISPWSYVPVTIEARNDLPALVADSYVKPKNGPSSLTVPAPGVLGVSCTSNTQCTPGTPGTGADRSSDNPTTYVARRAVLVSGPVTGPANTPIGTVALNPNGGFTFNYPSSFTGFVTFQYKANDGFWSVDPTVPMNGKDGVNELFSGPVTVTIEVK
jgi:hypothetical protein